MSRGTVRDRVRVRVRVMDGVSVQDFGLRNGSAARNDSAFKNAILHTSNDRH